MDRNISSRRSRGPSSILSPYVLSLKPLQAWPYPRRFVSRSSPHIRYKAIVAMDGVSGSHSFWGSALRDLLAALARFRSPEFEALLTGFIGVATRLCNEFERILDEARRSRLFQDLERIRSGPPAVANP
jgi:hypothetical protein